MATYLNPHAIPGFDDADNGSVIMKNGDGVLSFDKVEDGKLPKVFITGEIPTEKGPKNPAKIEYIYKDEHWLQYITIALQGNSSLSYPKKNFNIVMYGDDETRTTKHKTQFSGWEPYNKFTLKANYIDPTHGRNIISCRLFADAVKTRQEVPDPRLLETPMMGMIDGFKIQLYINGYYQGMYTWNIAKGEWMFGMTSDGKGSFWLGEAVNDDRTMFRSTITQEELDTEEFWTEEFVGEGNTPEEVLDSYNNLVEFVMNSTDEEFKSSFGTYMDLSEDLSDKTVFYLYES